MKNSGAGFVIGRKFPDGSIRFLGLVAPFETRSKKGGFYDIPKGKVKKGESSLEGAIRECFEESGIKVKVKDIVGDPITKRNLTVYAAITSKNPKLKPNPETGIWEHMGMSWLTGEEIKSLCLKYLKPFVKEHVKTLSQFEDKN